MRNIIVTLGLVATMAAPIAAQTKARTQDRIPRVRCRRRAHAAFGMTACRQDNNRRR